MYIDTILNLFLNVIIIFALYQIYKVINTEEYTDSSINTPIHDVFDNLFDEESTDECDLNIDESADVLEYAESLIDTSNPFQHSFDERIKGIKAEMLSSHPISTEPVVYTNMVYNINDKEIDEEILYKLEVSE